MSFTLRVSAPADDVDVAMVRENLSAFNLARMGRETIYKRLAITARFESGSPIGGLVGSIGWDWLYIELLWVAEDHRGGGVGTALINKAERAGVEAGVTRAHTTTASFQARPFYEKRGYTVFGELRNKPQGHTLFFMKNEDIRAHG